MAFLTLFALAVIAAPSPKIGFALNVPDGGGKESFLSAMREQIRVGADGGNISLKWDEYESQNGKPLEDGLSGAEIMGQEPLLTISTLDTTQRRLPEDVKALSFNDPKMEARFDGFLTAIAPKIKGRVAWVSLGNEVNVYLQSHPDEVNSYGKFLAHSREVLHGLLPNVQIGVTVTLIDGITNSKLVETLGQGMDVAIYTYYPLEGVNAMPPNVVTKHFDFMKQEAQGKPYLLQEIGYPSDPANGGSEALQAEFVKNVFGEIDRAGDSLKLACFFIQTDFSPAVLSALDKYYAIPDPKFHSFLGSLGFHDSAGKPKAAWDVFRNECLKRKPVR